MAARYVIARIPVGRNGKRLYVANRLDDTVTCVNVARGAVAGTIIPVLRCDTCHFGPVFTSNQLADVGTRRLADRARTFDTPQLLNLAYKTSCLHDGSARTLKELWMLFNPRDLHGVTSDLSSAELDDLVEYLKTL